MFLFFFNDTATTEIYTLSLHDALPICARLRGREARLQPHRQIAALTDEAQPLALRVQLLDLALERFHKQAHETADLLRRPPPVLAREGKQREGLHAAARALLDTHAHRGEPGAVPGGARQATRRGPAAVAVHGDRDVPGRELGGGGDHQTCMTSFSLAASSASMSAMGLSVSFCTSVSAPRSSPSED